MTEQSVGNKHNYNTKMKKLLFALCMLLTIATAPVIAAASENALAAESITTSAAYVGTLNTVMGSKTSTQSSFTVYYADGTLEIPAFQIGSMPGTIEVYASDLTLGVEKKCIDCVTLTIAGVPTTYNAKVCVSKVNGKLNATINVLNPVYEGLSFVAQVSFVQD